MYLMLTVKCLNALKFSFRICKIGVIKAPTSERVVEAPVAWLCAYMQWVIHAHHPLLSFVISVI